MKRNLLLFAAISMSACLLPARALWAADAAPPATQPAGDVDALIHQLGDDDFHVRQSATDKLKQMGKAAIPALKEAKKSTDPEIHARADELLQEIDHPAPLPIPQPTGFGSQSMRVSVTNGDKSVDVEEPGRTVHIEENQSGITMKVTGKIDGKDVTRDIKAKNAEQLKKDNPQAFALYQQYGGAGNGGAVQFHANAAGGVIIHGNINIQGGPNGVIVGPNVLPVPQQPPAWPNPTGDDLDKLESRLLDQMKAGNVPDAQQDEVKRLMKELKDALPKPDNAAKGIDAQMRDYNAKSDALRKELLGLKLPDPGDALPPPSWGRLGISATEELINGQGLIITHVLPDSRAERIGLKEQDVIQKVNGKEIHATSDLRKVVTENPKGLVVEGLRDGKPFKLEEPAK